MKNYLRNERIDGRTQAILLDCFQKTIGQFIRLSAASHVSLFLCDPNGFVIDRYLSEEHKDLPVAGLLDIGTSWCLDPMGMNAVSECIETDSSSHVVKEDHSYEALQSSVTVAVPIHGRSLKLKAVLGLLVPACDPNTDYRNMAENLFLLLNSYYILDKERSDRKMLETSHQLFEEEAKRRDTIFQVAKRLHSIIDVNSLLSEFVSNLRDMYPSFHIDLYLTQDNHTTNLHVKPLIMSHNEADLCTRAFMEGILQLEPAVITNKGTPGYRAIAAPLSGKQGVYGVLHLFSEDHCFDDLDTKAVSMLADTAGTAFENARLYEQSNLLIVELRLINEITKSLNQSLKLQDVFQFATHELLDIFHAEYCVILQLDKESNRLTVQASNLPELSNETFSTDYGYAGTVFATKESVIVSDYKTNRKTNSLLMDVTDSRSLIASPIVVNNEALGAVLVCHRSPNFFSYENYRLLQVLSVHIGLAITNASLHAEVRRMVITDNLTGLHARHYLDEQVNHLQKKDACGSLIVVDIDNFKSVNDTYGHQVGDTILIQVSNIIRSSIRESDIAARWGGEELAIYLPQVNVEQTTRVAERIRKRVELETEPKVTVSCGISQWQWEDDKISSESLFYKADMALYVAKNSGKNRIEISI